MSNRLYFLVILSAFIILLAVFFLIRRKKIAEEYSLIWLVVALCGIVGAVSSKLVTKVYSVYKGIFGAGPEILVYLVVLFLIFFLLYISIKLTEIKQKLITVIKTTAILQAEVDSYKKTNKQEIGKIK